MELKIREFTTSLPKRKASTTQLPSFRPTVYWYPSFRCNLACKHCWVDSSPKIDTSQDLGTEDMFEVVDQIIELNAGSVIMSGGEALYRPDVVMVIRKLVDADVQVCFETNGLMFSPSFIRCATHARDSRLPLGITVSVDGGTEESHNFLRGKGTFQRTMEGLQSLYRNEIKFDVQCVINAQNIDTIESFVTTMSQFRPHVRNLQFAFLNPVGRGAHLAKRYGMGAPESLRAYKEIARMKSAFDGDIIVKVPPAMVPPGNLLGLFGGRNKTHCSTSCAFPTLGVLNNGNVSICAITRADSDVIFGNITEDRLLDIWHSARLDIMRKTYLEAEGLTGICGDCIFQKECKGSCRAYAFEESGDFNAPHPLCAELESRGGFPDAYRVSKQKRPPSPEKARRVAEKV